MTREWKNVPGTLNIELSELVIEFKSSGYYTPMSMYGGPDHTGWPAEGDDCRELVRAYITTIDNEKILLSPECAKQMFDLYRDKINAAEIDCRDD